MIVRHEREFFKRTVFVSLPHDEKTIDFVQNMLQPQLKSTYSRLNPICYLDFDQLHDFTKEIYREIYRSNAIIAFLKGLNSNVMLEVGRAMALGKPYIAIAPKGQELPSLLKNNLTIFYEGDQPSKKDLDLILAAINKAVIRPSVREKNESRMNNQLDFISGKISVTGSIHERLSSQEIDEGVEAFYEAQNEYRNGNIHAAIEILDDCIKNDFKTEEIYHLKADCYFLLGESADKQSIADKYYHKFLDVAQKGLNENPGSTALRKDRGNALVKGGHYTEATTIFKALIREESKPVYLYNLACIYSLMSMPTECLSYLEQAIAQEPFYQTLARMDTDFENIWENAMFQALIFQKKIK